MDTDELFYLNRELEPTFIKKLKHCTTDSWGTLVHHNPDSSYLLLETDCAGNNPPNGAIIKYDKSFNSVKLVSLPEPLVYKTPGLGEFYNPLAPNSIWLVGTRVPPPAPSYPIPIIINRLDKNLNKIWTKYFEDGYARDFPWIYATEDGGLLLAGTRTKSIGLKGKWTAFLMKIDSSGNLPTNNQDFNKELNWSATVFPNPSNGYFGITLDQTNDEFMLRLINNSGQIVYQSDVLIPGKYHINLQHLEAGNYFYKLYYKGVEKASGQWIKS